jgi:hypothetical protein
VTETSERRAINHALWAGPLLALLGYASYWTLFPRWPALSDVPWVNLSLLALGLALSLLGLRRAWRRGLWRPAVAVLGVGFSALLGYGLIVYCFSTSYGLPESPAALAVGDVAPAVSLPDTDDQVHSLNAAGTTLVVFYRGHW